MKRVQLLALMTVLVLLVACALPALAKNKPCKGGTDVPICIGQDVDITQIPVGRETSRAREPRGLFDFANLRAFIRAILGF